MSEYFVGEIEIESDQPGEVVFSDFSALPNRELISSLAERHKSVVELMPYQKQGQPVKLLVSVYLKKAGQGGRIIVVLLREDYPDDIESLRVLIRTAQTRLNAVAISREQFDSSALDLADRELGQIMEETQ